MNTPTSCLNHSNVPATVYCRQCHKPLCKDCASLMEGEIFCGQECKGRFDAFKGRWREIKPKRGLMGKLIKLAIAAAICLIVVKIGAQRGVKILVRIDRAIFGK